MYTFTKISPIENDWMAIEHSCVSSVFHVRQWYDYLSKVHHQNPYIVSISQDEVCVGYFCGTKAWRLFTVIESPMMGTGTYTQGLVMIRQCDPNERVVIYNELKDWIFSTGQAQYIKIDDWALRVDEDEWTHPNLYRIPILDKYGLNYSIRQTFVVDLHKSVEDMWAALHYKSCKYCINKARKQGLHVCFIENKADIPAFVKLLREQICNVSERKHEAVRSYQAPEKLQAFCETLYSNHVVMCQVLYPQEDGSEKVIASGLWGVGHAETIYWAGASYAEYQYLCPNELMAWEAMVYIKRNFGDTMMNMGGLASYKKKFGSQIANIPRIEYKQSKYVFTFDQLVKTTKRILHIKRK